MAKAMWNGAVVAESDATVIVEGNHYFPPEAVNHDLLTETDSTSVCFWKGTANYFSVAVDGEVAKDAAWIYRDASERAKNIQGYYAFWGGVKVEA